MYKIQVRIQVCDLFSRTQGFLRNLSAMFHQDFKCFRVLIVKFSKNIKRIHKYFSSKAMRDALKRLKDRFAIRALGAVPALRLRSVSLEGKCNEELPIAVDLVCRKPYTLHPTPYTLHPTPYTFYLSLSCNHRPVSSIQHPSPILCYELSAISYQL